LYISIIILQNKKDAPFLFPFRSLSLNNIALQMEGKKKNHTLFESGASWGARTGGKTTSISCWLMAGADLF
jgi:hypothetical protein